jgi:vacuolar protein sorting-associated protein 13A/C
MMNLARLHNEPLKFISSDESETEGGEDLFKLTYKRVQSESPEFLSKFEGIEQAVDVSISTFAFRASPEPVLDMYDFIMTTFAAKDTPSGQQQSVSFGPEAERSQTSEGKIQVQVDLASVERKCSLLLHA